MGKNDTPSFAEILENAQRVPERGMRDIELTSPFQSAAPDHRMVDDPRQINGVPEFDYRVHVRYLTIPNDANEYEAILNQAAEGKCVIRSEDKTFTKEGDFIVVVQYMVRIERPGQANRRRRDNDNPL